MIKSPNERLEQFKYRIATQPFPWRDQLIGLIDIINAPVIVDVKINTKGAQIPRFMTAGAACTDLSYCGEESVELLPGKRCVLSTGLSVELPIGYEMQIRPRSGSAAKKGLTVLNTPGTIDSDYRGDVKVILYNAGDEPAIIEPGDRIAQAAVCKVEQVNFVVVEALSETERSDGGLGSTGDK